MWWIIILGGVALIGFALYGIRCSIKEGLSDGVFIFIAGIIFAGLLALLGMFLAKINGVNKEYNYNLEENIKIIALQENSFCLVILMKKCIITTWQILETIHTKWIESRRMIPLSGILIIRISKLM